MQAHLQADGGPGPAGAQFDEVADLVDDPESLAAENVERRPAPAGQRVGDPALVVQLADEAVWGAPDMQRAAVAGVAERVGGDLADRQHEVGAAAGGEPGLRRVARDEIADRAQVGRVAEPGGAGSGASQSGGTPPGPGYSGLTSSRPCRSMTGWVRQASAMTGEASAVVS